MTEPGSLGGCVAEVNLTFAPLASDAYTEVLCEHETFLFYFFTVNIWRILATND